MAHNERAALERIRRMANEALENAARSSSATENVAPTLLPVPYLSQNGVTPGKFSLDSGAAAGCMLVGAYTSRTPPASEFLTRIRVTEDKLLSPVQVKAGLAEYTLLSEVSYGATVGQIYTSLAAAAPVILLLRHSVLRDAGLTPEVTDLPHYVVAVGFDIEHIYVHDPLRKGEDGVATRIPLLVFYEAWTLARKQPQFDRVAIIPQNPLRRYMIATKTLSVHSTPSIHSPEIDQISEGALFTATRFTAGWGCIGENRWVNLSFARDI